MSDLSKFTTEEIKYICSVIPYQETSLYLQKYPKEFAKLKPGFRVKALTKEMIFRILYEFQTKDFISSFLVRHIDKWVEDIEEELEKAHMEGLNEEEAYISVLSESYFSNNIALFF